MTQQRWCTQYWAAPVPPTTDKRRYREPCHVSLSTVALRVNLFLKPCLPETKHVL